MERPVVHFELVGRDGASLEGFVSYSEVFGDTATGAVMQLQDELPDDVTFYVSVGAPLGPRIIERPAARRTTIVVPAAPSR
jgi:hypothetical protein